MIIEVLATWEKPASLRDFVKHWLITEGDPDGEAIQWLLDEPKADFTFGKTTSYRHEPAIIAVLPDDLAVLFRLSFPDFIHYL